LLPRGPIPFSGDCRQLLEQHRGRLPERVRRVILAFWSEAEALEQRMREVEKELEGIAGENPVIRSLMSILPVCGGISW
jgi:hypothetical protein